MSDRVLAMAVLALFGLLFGSFANVMIWRFPRGESLSYPGSHCPKCDAPIAWFDNVPVLSWLALHGMCRTCAAPIAIRYPLAQLTSGALWLAAGLRFGVSFQTAAAVFFFYLLMILAFIDLDTMRLPNPLVALLAAIGLVGAASSQLSHVQAVPLLSSGGLFGASPLASAVGGALVCAVPALMLSVVMSAILKRPALGMGDVKLLGVIGIFIGAYGLLALFVGSLLGVLFGVARSRSRTPKVFSEEGDASVKGSRGAAGSDDMTTCELRGASKPFPFGPALALGAVIATLVGPQLWTWYQSLFMV